MKFHGIETVGKLVVEKLDSLPTFDGTRDEGRLVYLNSNGRIYFGDSSKWTDVAPFVKHNFTASAAPTSTDDENDGYQEGSVWIDQSADPKEAYRCVDSTADAAEWVNTSLEIGELGTLANQDKTNVDITGGSITGINDLKVVDGGTGASTASAARNNLGLKTMATQAADNVSITGGSITGISTLEMTGSETVATESWVDSHITGGTGIDYSTGTITNTDTGSDAVNSHETTYDHTAYLTDITNESINDLSDVEASAPTDEFVLAWNATQSYWEPTDLGSISTDAPVDSVFGRTGTVTASADDYSASQVTNDSTVSGTYVDDALNNLDGHDNTYHSETYLTDITTEVIGDLSNVDTSGVSDGQVLQYNSTTTNWEAQDAPAEYTDSDVDAHLTGGTGIDYSTGTISIDSTVVQNSDIGNAAERNYTISTSDPSGGSDGDVWYKVES